MGNSYVPSGGSNPLPRTIGQKWLAHFLRDFTDRLVPKSLPVSFGNSFKLRRQQCTWVNKMKQIRISTITLIAVILAVSLIIGGTLCLIGRGGVEEINLGPEDNGRILDFSAGVTVVIKLPENPSTGYTWQHAVNENIVELVEDVYIPPENQIVGGGGTRMLKLEVIGSGEFAMDYDRPWENQPVDHFSVTFRV